jgi:hypothetical protein
MVFTVPNPSTQRWCSFASMIAPSNDFFLANANPTAHQLFNASGVFTGPVTIQLSSDRTAGIPARR